MCYFCDQRGSSTTLAESVEPFPGCWRCSLICSTGSIHCSSVHAKVTPSTNSTFSLISVSVVTLITSQLGHQALVERGQPVHRRVLSSNLQYLSESSGHRCFVLLENEVGTKSSRPAGLPHEELLIQANCQGEKTPPINHIPAIVLHLFRKNQNIWSVISSQHTNLNNELIILRHEEPPRFTVFHEANF